MKKMTQQRTFFRSCVLLNALTVARNIIGGQGFKRLEKVNNLAWDISYEAFQQGAHISNTHLIKRNVMAFIAKQNHFGHNLGRPRYSKETFFVQMLVQKN